MDADSARPHAGRMLDFYLGGTLHTAADRAAARRMLEVNPHLITSARVNRRFIDRSVRYLVGSRGITQFLDLGSGIPTRTPEYPNLHESAQAVDPACRVVYVDNDPAVRAYAAELLTSTPRGRAVYVEADVTDGAALYERPEIAGVLDLTRPVALGMNALLHFFADDAQARGLVEAFTGPLAAGSHLTLTHITRDWAPEVMDALVRLYREDVTDGGARSRAEIEALVGGLDVVSPGVVNPANWRPGPGDALVPAEQVNLYALLARVT
ncbi:SAM-dependent methyltransferase [Streptomyces sp. NPDC088197]|uniref:SAM-dependent methyltransferase n=1 Tax=unclassified Streptomyces TaxID=2593676 RepID=UPI0036E70D32